MNWTKKQRELKELVKKDIEQKADKVYFNEMQDLGVELL